MRAEGQPRGRRLDRRLLGSMGGLSVRGAASSPPPLTRLLRSPIAEKASSRGPAAPVAREGASAAIASVGERLEAATAAVVSLLLPSSADAVFACGLGSGLGSGLGLGLG